MNLIKLCAILFIAVSFVFKARAADSLADLISRITMDCGQHDQQTSEALHRVLLFSAERIAKLNPELKSHMISRMKKKTIHVKCGFDQRTIEELSLPPMADAVTSDFWERDRVQITIRDGVIQDIKDYSKNPETTDQFNFIMSANVVVHELLHALDLDNQESSAHNYATKNGRLSKDDTIYACSYVAIPIFNQIADYEADPFSWNCENCYFAKKRSARSLRSQSPDSEPVRIEIRPNSRQNKQARAACESLRFNPRDIFSQAI